MNIKANESPEGEQAQVSNKPLDLDRRLIPSKPKGDGTHPMFFSDEMEKVPDYGITLGRLQKKIVLCGSGKDSELAQIMNRGSNASVDTVMQMGEIDFEDWLDDNAPIRNMLKQWMSSNKMFSTGSLWKDFSKYLFSIGYGNGEWFPQLTFEEFLKDIRN